MSYRYPYGNTEQMNLDWFLKQWEIFKADWDEAEAGIDGALDAEIARVEAAMTELYAARDAAAASAAAARQSSLDAVAAQVAAGNSKTAAQAAETGARGSQQAAAASAQEAQASAQGAENSALTATQAANTATQQAAGADAAKGAAEAAQQAAEAAQAAAAQSAGQAGQAATAAGDHADDAADSATLAQQAAQDMSASVAQITTNTNDISDLKESIGELTNLADGVTWYAGGYIRHSDGEATGPNANQRRSTYIDLTGINAIVYTQLITTGTSQPAGGIAFYSDKSVNTYISGIPSSYGANAQGAGRIKIAEVPSGANYARFSWWVTEIETQPFVLYNAEEYLNYLPNKSITFDTIVGETDLITELMTKATIETGVINSVGKLATGSSRASYELENNYSAITVTADKLDAYVSFLTGSIHGMSSGASVPLCENEPPRHVISAGETASLIIPDDCTHIVISYNIQSGINAPFSGYLYSENSALVDLVENAIGNKVLPELSILFIGNSLALDSVSYVPSILESIGVEANLVIGILCLGGRTLRLHYKHWTNNEAVYTLYESINLQPWISSLTSCTGLDAITHRKWDVISFQQASTRAGTYSTYQPYLTNLVEYINNHVDYKWKMAWNNVHSTSVTNEGAYGPDDPEDIDETEKGDVISPADHAKTLSNYNELITALNLCLAENPIEIVFPVATATQNARATSLAQYGAEGELLYDGKHAQEGIACQVEGYTVAIKMLELLGIHNKSILNDNTVIDSAFETSWNIQGQHGTPEGSTDDTTGIANRRIAQKCAVMACQRPMELSNILVPITP